MFPSAVKADTGLYHTDRDAFSLTFAPVSDKIKNWNMPPYLTRIEGPPPNNTQFVREWHMCQG